MILGLKNISVFIIISNWFIIKHNTEGSCPYRVVGANVRNAYEGVLC